MKLAWRPWLAVGTPVKRCHMADRATILHLQVGIERSHSMDRLSIFSDTNPDDKRVYFDGLALKAEEAAQHVKST